MHVRFVNHVGSPIEIVVRQDGEHARPVMPGRRTRFKITQAQAVALHIEKITLGGNLSDWLFNDVRIGGRSQFSDSLGGGTAERSINEDVTPERDGFDGDIVCEAGPAFFRSEGRFDTVQMGMSVIFDVTYLGTNPKGQWFNCTATCTVFDAVTGNPPAETVEGVEQLRADNRRLHQRWLAARPFVDAVLTVWDEVIGNTDDPYTLKLEPPRVLPKFDRRLVRSMLVSAMEGFGRLHDTLSQEEIDQDLRDGGGNPEEIGKRGAALVRALVEKRANLKLMKAINDINDAAASRAGED